MTQTSLNWSAIIAALVSLGGVLSLASGHPALAAVFSDPTVQTQATAAVSAAGALVSAFSSAVHVPVVHTPSTSASLPTSH